VALVEVAESHACVIGASADCLSLKTRKARPMTGESPWLHMERGLYIAASGMVAEQARQDRVANDLANASTPGYKPSIAPQESFGAILLGRSVDGQPVGSLSAGVASATPVVDLSEGAVKETDEPLDFAIQGDGFFSVQSPQGVQYTRNGQLTLDANRRLVTSTGDPVLDAQGRTITLPNGTPVVAADGTISVSGKQVAKLALTSVNVTSSLGGGLYTGKTNGAATGTVRQGALEGSGADPMTAMVDMMDSMRAYEAGQRVLHALDDSLGKAVSAGGLA
jgi:flagellar basal-body rod protein FlgG